MHSRRVIDKRKKERKRMKGKERKEKNIVKKNGVSRDKRKISGYGGEPP